MLPSRNCLRFLENSDQVGFPFTFELKLLNISAIFICRFSLCIVWKWLVKTRNALWTDWNIQELWAYGLPSFPFFLLSNWFRKTLIWVNTLLFFQRLKYQYTDCHLGKHDRRFLHWQPVRTMYSSASIIVFKSCRLLLFKSKNPRNCSPLGIAGRPVPSVCYTV